VTIQISSVSPREGTHRTGRSDGKPENISEYFTINHFKWTLRLNLILLKLTFFLASHWRFGYTHVFFRSSCFSAQLEAFRQAYPLLKGSYQISKIINSLFRKLFLNWKKAVHSYCCAEKLVIHLIYYVTFFLSCVS